MQASDLVFPGRPSTSSIGPIRNLRAELSRCPVKQFFSATGTSSPARNMANSWLAFFLSPRSRSFTNPNFSFITPNPCSTFERTVDFVRFFARSISSTRF